MIEAIIVEDRVKKSDELNRLLEQHFPEISVLKTCNSYKEAVIEVIALQPHLIFLDVELDDGYTGFDLLEETRSLNYSVIFTTSYGKYAAKAFKFDAIDYIEGLIGFEELNEAIKRYKTRSGLIEEVTEDVFHIVTGSNNIQKVGIPVVGGIDFITVSDIIYCKAANTCTDFYLINERKILATKTLKCVEELMREHHFLRIHDSYLINPNHLKKYKREGGGEGGVVELTDQKEADVSRRRRDDFLNALSNLNMIFNK